MIYLLHKDGSSEPFYATQITKNFSVTESRFQEDVKLYGECTVCVPLFTVLQRYRELKGKPVNLNSLNRDRKKQEQLIKDGFRAATVSPHEFALAADVDTEDAADTLNSIGLMRQAAKEVKIGVRLGWKEYMKDGSSFIHVDVCSEYFGKGKVWNHVKHPQSWEISGLEW